MKALTLWQPWASLIAAGHKRIETRAWATRYRGPLAIHAAARPLGIQPLAVGPWTNVTGEPVAAGRPVMSGPWIDAEQRFELLHCPPGVVVATALLADCLPIVEPERRRGWPPREAVGDAGRLVAFDDEGTLRVWVPTSGDLYRGWIGDGTGEHEAALGDYTPGRWAWLLDEVEALDPPPPARGRQGLWEWVT